MIWPKKLGTDSILIVEHVETLMMFHQKDQSYTRLFNQGVCPYDSEASLRNK